MENEEKIQSKFDKFKIWLKDPYNLGFFLIFLSALALRLYYFILTKNQPVWWDESSYLAAAKNYVGIGFYHLESIRLPLFPFLISLFYRFGIYNEGILRFFLLFIPSIIFIFIAYVLLNKMYSRKGVALISLIIITVLWEHLFYSNRFHTENLAMIFEFLAIIFTVKLYSWVKQSKKSRIYNILAIIILSFLSVLARPGNLIFVPGLFMFLIILAIIHSKYSERTKNILFILVFIVLPILFILLLPTISKISLFSTYYHPESSLGWKSLTVFSGFYLNNTLLGKIFFSSLIIGFVVYLIKLILIFDKIKIFIKEDKDFSSNTLNLLIILSVFFSMIFILRANSFEYRWFFPLLPGMLAFTSSGLLIIGDWLKKIVSSKNIIILVLVFLLILGIIPQISYSNQIIKVKLDSYSQVKDSGLWIKENTNISDILISDSVPQHSYYSERKVMNFNQTKEQFEEFKKEVNPNYAIVSLFENYPSWVYDWIENTTEITPIKVYYTDMAKTQPILIIYKFN